jgi:hypothetical protein
VVQRYDNAARDRLAGPVGHRDGGEVVEVFGPLRGLSHPSGSLDVILVVAHTAAASRVGRRPSGSDANPFEVHAA